MTFEIVSDGSIYFSDASKKHGLDDVHLDLLEARPHGQVLKYNPTSNEVSIVLSKLHFANGVALSQDKDYLLVCETWKVSDGSIYFSDASKKHGLDDVHLDLLEARPHGQVLKYNPTSNEVSIVLSKLHFANGVALSQDKDYLLVCETWKVLGRRLLLTWWSSVKHTSRECINRSMFVVQKDYQNIAVRRSGL
ncbi:hypothetical protein PIB30_095638 [Stylosanthes scabra]|uniref:Strictosidine synthase conserved region domain-containing protein n=1 Tax=Stylosanthes scabra TaxID=79078 RepID=A0ABU6QWH5_9FABA|nr:hypothetical protein [Stylosanthes scabra]